jgi:hypothetical protein
MKIFRAVAFATLLLPLCALAQTHQIPTLDRNNPWTGVNSYTQSPQVPEPTNNSDAVPKDYVDTHSGGANLPHVTQQIGGDGAGNGVGMPEEGITVAGGVGTKAWNEDKGLGFFDCRDTKYAGGCLGSTPGLAMQALANDLVCYNTSTGLKGTVLFPPGTFSVGTDSQPTLKFPTGNTYIGEGGITGTATIFQATYNNHGAVEWDTNLTATCSGTVKTDTLNDGAYLGLGEHGCGQGGCHNVPGDSVTYGTGGPAQTGIVIADSQGWVDRVGTADNGGDGLMIEGIDTHTGNLWGNANNVYRIFGRTVGPTYDPSTDGVHCSICLNSLDGIFSGPNETYGFTPNPGPEYGHVVEVFVGGGMTQAHQIFVNRGEIGLQRGRNGDGSNFSGHITNVRIDGTTGAGIRAEGTGDFFTDATVTGPCSAANVAWSSVGSVTIATPGGGQTNGTYTLTGSGGLATTGGLDGNGGAAGVNATIQVVVAGGIATSVTVTNAGAKYSVPGANPTFTMTAGGTPATFTVTKTLPLSLSPSSLDPAGRGFCDAEEDLGGAGGVDHYDNIRNQGGGSFGFGSDFSTGSIWPLGGIYRGYVNGYFETPGTEATGQSSVMIPLVTSVQPSIGSAPDVELGGIIQPADSTPTNITTLSRLWYGEQIDIVGGNANATLISTLNGGNFLTCSGYNINLALPVTHHFVVTAVGAFGTTITENCNSIDQNHWWVNHVANATSLPLLEQQGTVDAMGDIRSHSIPALVALTIQAGGIPGPNGVGGTFTYAYRVWGPFGTQTSALSGFVNQCLPLPGFVNNPCFQTSIMTLPEGWTHYRLYRESSTDSIATAGLIDDVTATAPQHALSQGFADTRIAPINSTTIGSGNYGANMTGGPWECGTLPPVSAYPAVAGQRCESPATGICYWADATDHWKSKSCAYSNF